jgi:hypothetical protein
MLDGIYTVEQTKQFRNSVAIYYGGLSHELPLTVKDKVKPGTKILVVQQSEYIHSPIEGIYALGDNLQKPPATTTSAPGL